MRMRSCRKCNRHKDPSNKFDSQSAVSTAQKACGSALGADWWSILAVSTNSTHLPPPLRSESVFHSESVSLLPLLIFITSHARDGSLDFSFGMHAPDRRTNLGVRLHSRSARASWQPVAKAEQKRSGSKGRILNLLDDGGN
jgi:hypothetical protein